MDQKEIGPSFVDELATHGGLLGQHFSWMGDGTIEFFEDTPAEVVTGVQAVYAAHDPSKLSVAEITTQKAALMTVANTATSGMSDAFIAGLLDDADAAKFKAWAAYKFALGTVDMTAQPVPWPTAPSQ